ncbi:tRNA pseudouridine(55) synthase TruB [Paenibacillus eucommiae]|uniref:tRNA pseudouridine synthase B n=1 Tax=Paenibacillus eucommiae TaxID=1355755 RepID=A0ABS4IUM8_9BACL|nr:tRNA pseudouridine(55) synthase TruB [Paenibacillus eucommiae]MBP1991290.1 tRNA pseudouridine55 synthase [Paenibacillus eucommiae]
MTLEGVLPVLKPEKFTSHDVVAKARRILGIKRIGHTGTLDPAVTGVLPLCIGRATRMVEYIQELPKVYEAVLLIGISTDTEDLTGTVLQELEQVTLLEKDIQSVFHSFLGEIEQTPPMYSAVKVDGKRLYELAREGKFIERSSRKVMIHDIQILDVDVSLKHPEVRFRVKCSKGTYIRTLCADLGKALGYPSVMKHLIRTSTGNIDIEQCLSFEQIEQYKAEGTLERYLIPLDVAVSHLPAVGLSSLQAEHALQGKSIAWQGSPLGDSPNDSALCRVYDPNHKFLGLFQWKETTSNLTPVKVFH